MKPPISRACARPACRRNKLSGSTKTRLRPSSRQRRFEPFRGKWALRSRTPVASKTALVLPQSGSNVRRRGGGNYATDGVIHPLRQCEEIENFMQREAILSVVFASDRSWRGETLGRLTALPRSSGPSAWSVRWVCFAGGMVEKKICEQAHTRRAPKRL